MTETPYVAEAWYEVQEVEDGIALIKELPLHDFACGNIWLVRGSERALLVDTGTGLGPLRATVKAVTDRPIVAFATAGYYDHAGGLHQFDSRLAHRLEADRIANPSPRRVVSERYLTRRAFKALPEGGFDPGAYEMRGCTPTRLVEDGDTIDIGDRRFEVVHFPGVTAGTSGLFEQETGILFTGEALSYDSGHVYDGEPPDYSDDADRPAFRASLERMLKLPVTRVYPGHYGTFSGVRLREIVADYLAGRTSSKFASLPTDRS
jgi:glyoxylase-like metal-dependent hydrolase (beta-lactamase superfamily II)